MLNNGYSSAVCPTSSLERTWSFDWLINPFRQRFRFYGKISCLKISQSTSGQICGLVHMVEYCSKTTLCKLTTGCCSCRHHYTFNIKN